MALEGEVASLEGVGVRFGATVALDNVSLRFRRGVVHALLGENGAGKSTALRVAAGQLRPHRGALRLPAGARVAWVPQELELPEDLSIAAWIFLGRERRSRGLLARQAMEQDAARWLARFRLDLAPQRRIATLSPACRKIVQILRALHEAPDLLLLDEPTAVLGEEHTALLFDAIRSLRQQGVAIAYVTHRLAEVVAIADQVSVLRDGRVVWSGDAAHAGADFLLHLMAGSLAAERPTGRPARQEPALEVRDLTCGRVRGFSLTVHGGEIVGLAGLAGAGRSTVIESIAGRLPLRCGSISVRGCVALIPEDRRGKGLAASLSVRENLFLPPPRWWIDARRERVSAQEWLDRLRIRASSVDAPVSWLSGGNQQKLLFARALWRSPRVLLADEPTAGVDVGTKAAIHQWMRDYAQQGGAVVMSSSEVSELLALCHRIVALREGRTVAEAASDEVNEARVIGWITGATEGAVIA